MRVQCLIHSVYKICWSFFHFCLIFNFPSANFHQHLEKLFCVPTASDQCVDDDHMSRVWSINFFTKSMIATFRSHNWIIRFHLNFMITLNNCVVANLCKIFVSFVQKKKKMQKKNREKSVHTYNILASHWTIPNDV